ncbi:hypothetical protein [uncultured Clostridium sp.]|nr:hypothetical protein [uncultured Clostridium sp.]
MYKGAHKILINRKINTTLVFKNPDDEFTRDLICNPTREGYITFNIN